jgi:hypothetical protein
MFLYSLLLLPFSEAWTTRCELVAQVGNCPPVLAVTVTVWAIALQLLRRACLSQHCLPQWRVSEACLMCTIALPAGL